MKTNDKICEKVSGQVEELLTFSQPQTQQDVLHILNMMISVIALHADVSLGKGASAALFYAAAEVYSQQGDD